MDQDDLREEACLCLYAPRTRSVANAVELRAASFGQRSAMQSTVYGTMGEVRALVWRSMETWRCFTQVYCRMESGGRDLTQSATMGWREMSWCSWLDSVRTTANRLYHYSRARLTRWWMILQKTDRSGLPSTSMPTTASCTWTPSRHKTRSRAAHPL